MDKINLAQAQDGELSALLKDVRSLVYDMGEAVSLSAPHIYLSALAFSGDLQMIYPNLRAMF